MTLDRTVAVPGMISEYEGFAALLESLSPAEWEAASRCAGWRVADVAAHVVGQLVDVAALRLEGLGSPEVTERQTQERRGRTPSQLAEELALATKQAADLADAFDDAAWNGPVPGGAGGSLGFGVEALFFDTFVHADDIRAAIGRPSVVGPGLRASLSHVAQELTNRDWRQAELKFEGFEAFPVSGGGGTEISGDPLEFVLVATGRLAPARVGLDDTVNIYRA